MVLKNRWAARRLEGEPTILIENGKVLEDKLAGVLLRGDDLLGMLRA